jgi:subtilisin family serine protease
VSGVGGFPTPFSGTSAAAPHGAGIAALLRGVLPALTSQQVRDALKTGAVDLLAPGFDNSTGAGRLDAMLTIAPFLNQPPVAVAGNDTTVECGGALTSVKLDGSNSYDPDGDPLTYTWSAPGVTFDDAHAVTPTGGFPLGETSVLLAVYDGAVAGRGEDRGHAAAEGDGGARSRDPVAAEPPSCRDHGDRHGRRFVRRRAGRAARFDHERRAR